MTYLAIDESGSMTTNYCNNVSNRWFCVAVIVLKNPKKIKRIFKRWVSNNLDRLKSLDRDYKMFSEKGKFKELKASLLREAEKTDLLNYLCQNNYFEVIYIRVDNTMINENLYKNTARAFNFVLGLALRYHLNRKTIIDRKYHLYIDERNTKAKARYSLEDYLNIQLALEFDLIDSLQIEYQESHMNSFIQIADFFANLYFSYLNTKKYNKVFKKYVREGYLNEQFIFPIPDNSLAE